MFETTKLALLFFLLYAVIADASAARPSDYFLDVKKEAHRCIRERDDSTLICWIKATPEKCEDYFSVESKKWYMCIERCGVAGYFSRTFGECSRDLD